MKRFSYIAYDAAGARHEGEISSLSGEAARGKLKDQGLLPVSIVPLIETSQRDAILAVFFGGHRPGLAELEIFTSQMALLLKNGIKIDQALATARKAVTNKILSRGLERVHEEVRAGASLAAALAKQREIFDPLYVSVVEVGEASGRLPEIFSELAGNLAFRKELRARTTQAMIYPAVILTVCVLAVIFIFNFIIPRFETLFSRLDEVPVYTGILLAVSRFFVRFQWFFYLAAPLLPFALARLAANPASREFLDQLMLKLPVTRRLAYTLENLRFSSSMALLLQSGVLLVDALNYSIRAVGNSFIRRTLLTVRDEVKHGGKLSQALGKTGFLPEIYAGVVEVGEQAGSLPEVFRDMEQRTKAEYERRLSGLVSLLEPLLILLMGLMVGAIVIIMLLSTVSLQQIDF